MYISNIIYQKTVQLNVIYLVIDERNLFEHKRYNSITDVRIKKYQLILFSI